MKKLIQTGVASIIYGDFQGKPNQELFRCPRELDDIDLRRYINEHRCLLGFETDTETEDSSSEDDLYGNGDTEITDPEESSSELYE